MDRRTALLALAALPALALPALAQGVNVAPIERYLRSLRSAEGRFRQTNPNGGTQTGASSSPSLGASALSTTPRKARW